MIDLKPYGAFIEHTIRPLLGETYRLLEEFDKRGIPLNGYMIATILLFHIITNVITVFGQIACTSIACFVAYKVFHG